MRFYNRQHRYYCGIDLHVKTMYVCILDAAGQVLLHRNVKSTPAAFLESVRRGKRAGVRSPAGLPDLRLMIDGSGRSAAYAYRDLDELGPDGLELDANAFPGGAAPSPSVAITDALRRRRS